MCCFTRFLLIMMLVANNANAAEMYVSTDEFGNKVYSDQLPEDKEYVVAEQVEIATIDWHQSPHLKNTSQQKNRKKSSRRHASNESKSTTECDKIRASIADSESLLRSRLKPDEFNRAKTKLSKARWNYRKHCT